MKCIDMLDELKRVVFKQVRQMVDDDLALSRQMAELRGERHWSAFLDDLDDKQITKLLQVFGAGLLGQKRSRLSTTNEQLIHNLGKAIARGIQEKRENAAEKRKQAAFINRMRGQRDLKQLRKMDPIDFEYWTAAYFKGFGFKNITVTTFSADFGVDVSMTTPKGKKAIVQCKRYSRNNTIGRPTVQQTYGAMKLLEADICYVVTTSRFTPPALELNRRRDIVLLDGEFLVSGKGPLS